MESKAKQLLTEIHKKNERLKTLNESGIPQVGIFWMLPKTLLAFGIPYTEGEDYGDFVNSPDDHYSTWSKVAKISKGLYGKQYSDDYTQFPRGRVLYNKIKKLYMVYMNKKHLNNEKLKNQIENEFRLPAGHVKFMHDMHYEK